MAGTKKTATPEIDTSPRFHSVKDAVRRFGGSAPWIFHKISHRSPKRNSVTSTTEEEELKQSLRRRQGARFEFEAEQVRSMTEGSRYEVAKAMLEIEKTKRSIRMAEARIAAARKMEEAARAVEAIAVAQGNATEEEEEEYDDNDNDEEEESWQTKEIQGGDSANGRVSLSQMLIGEQDLPVEKQRKRFGFIHVQIPIKKKTHPK
ncbi:hypothetical protein M569_12974 [Genlisea aurea]|uniref:Uncharacterized protein n=1 Tax=Genlisea aurea TaxID=192259 RepID=S8DG87_9LAMI|nr:hypothetical protein M569_12974 [Genlisea aurea]